MIELHNSRVLFSRSHKTLSVCVALLLLACFAGCAGMRGKEGYHGVSSANIRLDDASRRDLVTINSIKLLPVQLGAQAIESGSGPNTDRADSAAKLSRFTEILKQELDSGFDSQLVDSQGDGTLTLTLTTFHERVGGKIGAEEGAAVGFEMDLIRSSDRKSVWSFQFSRKDEALSSNLAKIGDKFGRDGSPTWRSAEDLFRVGVKQSVENLQASRTSAFLAGSAVR